MVKSVRERMNQNAFRMHKFYSEGWIMTVRSESSTLSAKILASYIVKYQKEQEDIHLLQL